TLSASFSNATVRLAIAPPAKGSTNNAGLSANEASHCRSRGINHVLPPGYRNGLRWGTLATLTISGNSSASLRKSSCLTIIPRKSQRYHRQRYSLCPVCLPVSHPISFAALAENLLRCPGLLS